MNTRITLLALTLALVSSAASIETGAGKASTPATAHRMKITIKTNNKVLTATLDDNPTAKAFANLLPLDLSLEDYANAEKIGYLPKKLPTPEAAPDGAGEAGELTYYAPWGNLAIFHRDFRYSNGIYKLGRLDAGVEEFRQPGNGKVRIELVQQR